MPRPTGARWPRSCGRSSRGRRRPSSVGRKRSGWHKEAVVLLDKKRLVITGVLTDDSLAFGVAKLAVEEGAEIVLTSFGRAMSLTERTAKRLPGHPPDILELDVN